MKTKEEIVINYYVLCNRLKNIVRTGWKIWNITSSHAESVADHIFGTQMLAISMYSEYQYDIDIKKVIFMLAIHELEEIIIGDIPMTDPNYHEKEKLGHDAIKLVLSYLADSKYLENTILEFYAKKTKEALFAYHCYKLECDLQSKLYDEESCVDLKNQNGNKTIENELVQKLLKEYNSWSTMWLKFGQIVYPYDENFIALSNYAINNNISENKRKIL